MSSRLPDLPFALQQQLLNTHIARAHEWLSHSRSGPRSDLPPDTVDPQTLHQLQAMLEELRVAEEELRSQNETLREAHEQIESERERYQHLFDEAPDGYIVTDAQGTIRAANQAAALMLNRPPHLLYGKPLIVHIALDRRPAFRRLLARISDEHKPARADLRLMPRKGPPVEVAVHAAADGRKANDHSIRWSLRDITASKEAAAARRLAIREQMARRAAQSSIKRLRFLAECTRASVQETGVQPLADACVAAAARFFCDTCVIYLLDKDELKPVARRSRNPEADARSDALQLLLGLDDVSSGPLRNVVDSGEPMVFPTLNLSLKNRREMFAAIRRSEARHTILAPIQGRTGNIGVICFHSSSEESGFGVQEVGTALEASSRFGLAVDNARLFAAAEAGNNAKTEFLATISHELRTPLTAVIGYAELLMGGLGEPLPPTAYNWLQRIRASAEHQVRLIEDILTYVRTEAEREGMRLSKTGTAEIIEQAAAVVRPGFENQSVTLEICAGENLTFTTDADRVRQILINLLSNALKFTPSGVVTVRAERGVDGVRLIVADTGVGISPNHLEKVFEAFWQADQSDTRRYGGSGLGLAVSRRLARQLGGELRVESELGQGSKFVLELPLTPPTSE